MEIVTSTVDKGDPMDIIYLDFSKAFDKVPKQRLLDKLKAHGIKGKVLSWISAWLSGRHQRTVLNGKFSPWELVWSGVPQGSVLGPLCFIIFINDIDDITILITIMNKFADDTKLGHRVITQADREVLQSCLDKLEDWATTWCMDFNVLKCKVLHVGRNNKKYEYTMKGVTLESVDKERDIGVIIDKSLKPSLQCAEAAKKAAIVLGQITRAFIYRDRVTFLKLYTQFVRCHMEFAIQAWAPWTAGDIEVLEKVQRRAVNLITGLKGKTYPDKLRELGLQSLAERRVRSDMIQVFKIMKGIDKVDKNIWFKTVGRNPLHQTRNNAFEENIIPTRSRTDVRLNFFSNRVVQAWNSLPSDTKAARTLNRFKFLLDKN